MKRKRGIGIRSGRALVCAAFLAAASSLLAAGPAEASNAPVNVPVNSGVCTVSVTLQFATPLSKVPALFDQFSISGVSSTCASISPTNIFFDGGGSVLVASCDAFVDIAGDEDVQTADGFFPSSISAAGAIGLSQWVFNGLNPSTFNATATLAASPGDIAACEESSLGSVTLTGVLAFADQTLLPL